MDKAAPRSMPCPTCRDAIMAEESGWVACGGCLTRHHAACWSVGCAGCGGGERLVPRPRPPSEAPPPGSLITVERESDEVVYHWPVALPWVRLLVGAAVVIFLPFSILHLLHLLRFRRGLLRLGPTRLDAVGVLGGGFARVQVPREEVGAIRLERTVRPSWDDGVFTPRWLLTVDRRGGPRFAVGAHYMLGYDLPQPDLEWLFEVLHAWKAPAQVALDPSEWVVCRSCLAREQAGRWKESNACPGCGCVETLAPLPPPERRRGKPPLGSSITVEREGDEVVYRWPTGGSPWVMFVLVGMWIVMLPLAVLLLVDGLRHRDGILRLGPRGLVLGGRKRNFYRLVELPRDQVRRIKLTDGQLSIVEVDEKWGDIAHSVHGLRLRAEHEWLFQELEEWRSGRADRDLPGP